MDDFEFFGGGGMVRGNLDLPNYFAKGLGLACVVVYYIHGTLWGRGVDGNGGGKVGELGGYEVPDTTYELIGTITLEGGFAGDSPFGEEIEPGLSRGGGVVEGVNKVGFVGGGKGNGD
jgi:hypothetical protein